MPAEAVSQLLSKEESLEAVEADSSNVIAGKDLLNVCILTADFWGLKTAGGTATAYHLLAAVLATEKNINVSSLTTQLHACHATQAHP